LLCAAELLRSSTATTILIIGSGVVGRGVFQYLLPVLLSL